MTPTFLTGELKDVDVAVPYVSTHDSYTNKGRQMFFSSTSVAVPYVSTHDSYSVEIEGVEVSTINPVAVPYVSTHDSYFPTDRATTRSESQCPMSAHMTPTFGFEGASLELKKGRSALCQHT